MDWTQWLVTGAQVDNAPSVTVEIESATPDESPYTLNIDQVVVANPDITAWLSGGTVGTKYTLKFKGTDNQTPERTYVRRATIKIKYK